MEQSSSFLDKVGKPLTSAEKFMAFGPLGVTAEDHLAIYSTPPDKLSENPGKTLAELMTDEEITIWIREQKKALLELMAEVDTKESEFGRNYLPNARKKLKASLILLKQRGRLPKEFEDFDPDKLE